MKARKGNKVRLTLIVKLPSLEGMELEKKHGRRGRGWLYASKLLPRLDDFRNGHQRGRD